MIQIFLAPRPFAARMPSMLGIVEPMICQAFHGAWYNGSTG